LLALESELCEHFVDVQNTVPPCHRDQQWLFTTESRYNCVTRDS
jgi:hypothetical protein